VTWWTNIRLKKSFSRDLCLLLKASGCIAVSGGLASDRLLKLIDKGVTVEQVARVTATLQKQGHGALLPDVWVSNSNIRR
jgi:hypothetical protein